MGSQSQFRGVPRIDGRPDRGGQTRTFLYSGFDDYPHHLRAAAERRQRVLPIDAARRVHFGGRFLVNAASLRRVIIGLCDR